MYVRPYCSVLLSKSLFMCCYSGKIVDNDDDDDDDDDDMQLTDIYTTTIHSDPTKSET